MEYTDSFKLLVEIINFTNGSNTVLLEKDVPEKFEPSDLVLSDTKNDPQRVTFNFLLPLLVNKLRTFDQGSVEKIIGEIKIAFSI